METKLSIKQRLTLINLLSPMASSAAKRKILNDMIHSLSLSEQEIKDSDYVEIATPEGGLSYKYHPANDPQKVVVFGETITDLLVKKLVELDKREMIDAELFPLYELFVSSKPDNDNVVPIKKE